MKQRLKSILLIDDDKATNWLHSILLEKAACTEQVISKYNGREALDYLLSDEPKPKIDLILLDLNMPVMDGWEFLEHYKQSAFDHKDGTVLAVLTSSLNPDDEAKVRNIGAAHGFYQKPLDPAALERMLRTFFAERF